MHETGPPPDASADPAPQAAAPPPHVPGYAIRKRLGQGGMATVYLATQQSLDRPVAIKVMAHAALRDEVARQRFENEARTIARLAHPNIVAIHEIGRTDDGRMYHVMSYLPNGDLSRHDLRGDPARIAAVLRALLAALGHAHARGIVHRDVKRENVLFDADLRPLLTDFGIATSPAPDTTRLTSAGTTLGSGGYMAPEQARGAMVDARADLYSVGVLAYELLTGTLPYRSDDGLALALMHAQDPIPRLPSKLRHWQAFIDTAMAKAPEQRYADADAMRAALDAIPVSTPVATDAADRRARGLLALAAITLLAVLGFAVFAFSSDDDVPAEPQVAEATAPEPVPEEASPQEAAPPADTTPAPIEATPPPATEPATEPVADKPPEAAPAPEQKRPTLRERARRAKGKVKKWLRDD
jgi:serine/threonine-protein kinase PpkA